MHSSLQFLPFGELAWTVHGEREAGWHSSSLDQQIQDSASSLDLLTVDYSTGTVRDSPRRASKKYVFFTGGYGTLWLGRVAHFTFFRKK